MENTYQDLITDIQSKNPKIGGKLEGGKKFKIKSDFTPAGDQPDAIKRLVQGAKKNEFNQVLLGVTGSGKTFTMAKVIEATNRPALILAPNKTLAAQLYGEMKTFFPDNAVEYFVSYYDYYTPEAYVPRSDTYIEKEASINEQIDRMRHSATRSLLERDDVLIVASVSCIYGLGSVEAYSKMTLTLQKNYEYNREQIIKSLVALQYKRNDQNFFRGTFRARGEYLEIFPSHLEDRAWRLSLFGDKLEKIEEFDPLTGDQVRDLSLVKVYANSHYITPKPTVEQAIIKIRKDSDTDYDTNQTQNNVVLNLNNATSGASNCVGMSFTTESNGEQYITAEQNDSNSGSDLAFGSRDSGSRSERMRLKGSNGLLYIPAAYSVTTSSAANMYVQSDGAFYRSTSSKRYKNTIKDATHGLADLLKLRSVTYKGNNDGDFIFGGLIAEEVHDAGLTEFVQYNDDDEPDALSYGNMVSLCIKAIQEQQEQIKTLEAKVKALESA